MLKHEVRFRVRYSETDQMGVVYHANYYVWMEIGRVELVRSLGLDYHHMEKTDGLLLTVVETNCRYLSPARYDQEIAVATEITSANARMIDFSYGIRCAATEKLLARGSTRHLWLNREFKSTRLPEKYLKILNASHDS